MDIRYKLYPHPVLISNTDDYIKSKFQYEVAVDKAVRELSFSFSMNLENKELYSLIEHDLAEFLIHIECSQTCYRRVVTSNEKTFTLRILEKFLNGRVTFCAFVVAKADLPAYTNSDFHPDYEGRSFFIDRGSILAVGGQYNLDVVKDT